MRFLEMGFAFAVLSFVVANAAISLAVALAWRWLRHRTLGADALFLLRILPAAGSAAIVLGLILPSFLLFEPRDTAERAAPALMFFVVVAAALVVVGARRVLRAWLETRRMERAWRSIAEPTTLKISARSYRVPVNVPLAALVGVFRPRLFVSNEFLARLLPGERQAVLDHEAAHVVRFDNLKRTAMALAPDCLSLASAAGEIESAWSSAAEEEADDRATGADPARSLDLAGALIKASHMTPIRLAPVSNFCDEATIARRVARLLDDGRVRSRGFSLVSRVAVVALLAACLSVAGPAFRVAYTATEAAVHLLNHRSW